MVLRLEPFHLVQGMLPGSFSMAAGRESQGEAVASAAQLSGHQQDLVAQGLLQGGVLKLRGQAEALEPVDEIVDQQQEMEVGLIGEEVAGGDAAQRVYAGRAVRNGGIPLYSQRSAGGQRSLAAGGSAQPGQRLGPPS